MYQHPLQGLRLLAVNMSVLGGFQSIADMMTDLHDNALAGRAVEANQLIECGASFGGVPAALLVEPTPEDRELLQHNFCCESVVAAPRSAWRCARARARASPCVHQACSPTPHPPPAPSPRSPGDGAPGARRAEAALFRKAGPADLHARLRDTVVHDFAVNHVPDAEGLVGAGAGRARRFVAPA